MVRRNSEEPPTPLSNGHAGPGTSAAGAERAETTLNVRFRVAAEPGLQGKALAEWESLFGAALRCRSRAAAHLCPSVCSLVHKLSGANAHGLDAAAILAFICLHMIMVPYLLLSHRPAGGH